MKPIKIVFFAFSILSILLLLTLFFPKKGINLPDNINLSFTSFNELISLPKHKHLNKAVLEQIKVIQAITDSPTTKDTTTQETKKIIADSKTLIKNVTPIEFSSERDRDLLIRFFKKVQKRNQLLRILHYGDSQIEGDRITSFLRYQLQRQFGGGGPGLIPPINFVSSFSIHQENSENWTRYSMMENRKYNFDHSKYGALISFSRFLPYNNTDTIPAQAWLTFSKSSIAFSNTKHFKRFKIYYGNHTKTIVLQVFSGKQLLDFTSLSPTDFGVYNLSLPNDPDNIIVKFLGSDSPDIYAVSFDNDIGIAVDNIPIRGSSGTFFTKLNYDHISKFYKKLNIGIILLEFGGNTLPYLKDSAAVEQYGSYFLSQIYRIKKILPNIPIIVIGVADMSFKEKTEYVTYPLLEKLRDEMKKAAFTSGCGYWNMYKAMGGKNSMPAWVDANPPLAAPDYTHFTAKGASIIANMFYNALIKEYNDYITSTKKEKNKVQPKKPS